MDKMRMETKDMANENFKKLAELFPNAVTEIVAGYDEEGNAIIERAIDKDVLMQEISTTVVDGNAERYQFTWPDKRKAIRTANEAIKKTLRPCKEESVDFDNTENLYIEGDNLDVLKLLQETYLGKIKMIYIDPPYNTGNDFVYNDSFDMSADEYADVSGEFDEENNRLVQNTDSNGRFHTDWLNMIYPRLKIARNLLSDDGVIFISIDENEVHSLKNICNEVFGESNFIAELIWSAGRKNDSKHVSVSHEYILCYFKNVNFIKENKIIWREKKQGLTDIYDEYDSLRKKHGNNNEEIESELKKWFKGLPDGHPAKDHSHYSKVDDKGIFFADNISWPGGGGPKYEILHPVTNKPVKVPSRGWLTNEQTMQEWIKQGRVAFGKDENAVPTLKSYLVDREYSVPYSVFYKDGRASSKRLASLLGDKVFENPKDEEVIKRLISFCGTNEGDIVLDFFSGSATTAHAVFLANLEQCISRKFILVQLPEIISEKNATSQKSKKVANNAISLCNSLQVQPTICEIGKERIRRAGAKIMHNAQCIMNNEKCLMGECPNYELCIKNYELDTGFRVLKLDSTNMKEVYYTPDEISFSTIDEYIDNIKEDRTPYDLLFQVMLELGVLLSSKIEEKEIDGKKIFNVADNFLIACFDNEIDETVITEIAKQQPTYSVMRDSSMATDSVATNFDQIFATYSPDTTRKVI